MARAPEPAPEDDGPENQSAPEIKAMLKRARAKPVSCAAGLDSSGQGLLLLAHNRGAKALAARLRKENEEAKLILWGTARVDMNEDPKTVLFALNKQPGSLRRVLKKTLKGTGYTNAEYDSGASGDDDE